MKNISGILSILFNDQKNNVVEKLVSLGEKIHNNFSQIINPIQQEYNIKLSNKKALLKWEVVMDTITKEYNNIKDKEFSSFLVENNEDFTYMDNDMDNYQPKKKGGFPSYFNKIKNSNKIKEEKKEEPEEEPEDEEEKEPEEPEDEE